ncbi:phosphoglycerate mutase, partial [human gut metagenome]
EEYKDVHLDICYCSPLIRARKTAEILLEGRNVPIVTDDRLKEMCFGEYEGIENSFSIPDCPINLLFFHPEQYTSSIGGAETFEELFGRTGEFLDEVIYPQIKEGKDILIVGHGAMNASIVCRIKNLPLSEFWSAGLEQMQDDEALVRRYISKYDSLWEYIGKCCEREITLTLR